MQEAPAHILALRASGTIIASDVEAAVQAALGSANAVTGLIVVIAREFDGYFAELSRGLLNVSRAHKNLTRIAVITEADRMDEAKLSGLGASATSPRMFSADDSLKAYDWVDAASTP